MTTLRLSGANGHNEDALTRYVKGQMRAGVDGVACFESQDQRKPLGRIRGTRLLEPGPEFSPRARSTSIVTRNEHARKGTLIQQVSEQIDRYERVAPDRVLVCEVFEHPVTRQIKGADGVAFFGLHPDAGPEALAGDDENHPLVRAYWDAMRAAQAGVGWALDNHLLVVLSGDLQVPISNSRPWSPVRMLVVPFDLRPRTRHIDWMLVDPRLQIRDVHNTKLHDHWSMELTMSDKQ